MKSLITGLLVLFTAFITTAQTSLSVAPGRLFFDVNSPRKTDKIRVFNNGKEKSVWQVYIQDWTRDSLGQKHFFPPGTCSRSCAKNISFYPSVLTVLPDSSADITVSINNGFSLLPTDTSRNAMIVISQTDDPDALRQAAGKKQASIVIKAEFAVHVYISNGASAKAITIDDFFLKEDTAGKKLQVYVHNTGLQPMDIKTRIELTDKTTGKEWKLDEIAAAIMPGDKRITAFALPNDLKKGNYLALAIVDCGDELPVKVGELSFDWNH